MKSKLMARIVCIVLALTIIGSIFAVCLPMIVNAAEPTTNGGGYISVDYVNVRSGAGTSYSIVANLRENTKITFLDDKLYSSEWYKIKINSTSETGFVHKDYVKADEVSENDPSASSGSETTGYINTNYVYLYSGAGAQYDAAALLKLNARVTLLSGKPVNTSWYNVKTKSGITGYVLKDYVTLDKPAETLTLSSMSETLYIGNEYAVTAKGAAEVSWKSSDTSVATVDSNGVVTAKNAGSATITATAGGASASCAVAVRSGSAVNISTDSVKNMRRGKSILLTSSTGGVSWKSSNSAIATVKNGVVEAKSNGYVTITAYTSYGAATCLINVIGRDNIRFVFTTPNTAPMNTEVTFKAITDTDRNALRFVVSNGDASYTVEAKTKVQEGDTLVWSASKKLDKAGMWTVKAYSKFVESEQYLTTPENGECELLITNSTDPTAALYDERRPSDGLINLLKEGEGYLPDLVPDAITSDPTIGHGKVVFSNEQFYNHITPTESYAYLCRTVNVAGYSSMTNDFLTSNRIKFNQQQFDAIVSFVYNFGPYILLNDYEVRDLFINTGTSGAIKAGGGGFVSGDDVNLRSNAGTGYSIIKSLPKNTSFTFADGVLYNSEWYKIRLSDGTTGYIYYAYVSSDDSTRNLANIDKSKFVSVLFPYHHAAGECYWGLLKRRVDEAEMFYYGDYANDGEKNKYGFVFTCARNSKFSIS